MYVCIYIDTCVYHKFVSKWVVDIQYMGIVPPSSYFGN